MQNPKIQIGEMYRKVQGIGSSNNTFALVTGSYNNEHGTVIQYNIYSDSKLYSDIQVSDPVRMTEEEFLTYYAKI